MTEIQEHTKADNQLISDDKEPMQQDPDEGSDAESLDSEGYSKNDPYAAMAKKIDRQKRIKEELDNSTIHKVSKSVIENKENLTFFERNLKRIIVFAMLMCLIAGNAGKLFDDMANADD